MGYSEILQVNKAAECVLLDDGKMCVVADAQVMYLVEPLKTGSVQ